MAIYSDALRLCNAPPTFENLMEQVLATIPCNKCVVYLDDIFVHAADFHGFLANLLKLHPKNCDLLQREVKFLGHVVGGGEVAADPAKVVAVQHWVTFKDLSELRSFVGLTSYYRRFIKDLATVASPLHAL